MTYVITDACIGTKDRSCVDVCPVDCIHPTSSEDDTGDEMLYINPDECIDCGACEPACPVTAIYAEDDVPDNLKPFIENSGSGAYEKLKAGEYVFIYNVGLKEMPMGLGNTILGYHRDVPVEGGPVLFGDGSVRILSVQEFRAAPQAAPGAGGRQ